MRENNLGISDWQALVNKPVHADDGKMIGIVSEVQLEKLVVSYGPVTPNKYLIPKSSIKKFEHGIVYLNEATKFIEDNYKFE
ncbi:MAG TPA: hypothetical protein VE622_04900 [Nitrososphaeraceae archaeon]|jgi:hypothetical protein|nr:hypothetical protein [Nitrososphaeraceae archaeon]